MPLATKNNAIILKDGKLAESCGCCSCRTRWALATAVEVEIETISDYRETVACKASGFYNYATQQMCPDKYTGTFSLTRTGRAEVGTFTDPSLFRQTWIYNFSQGSYFTLNATDDWNFGVNSGWVNLSWSISMETLFSWKVFSGVQGNPYPSASDLCNDGTLTQDVPLPPSFGFPGPSSIKYAASTQQYFYASTLNPPGPANLFDVRRICKDGPQVSTANSLELGQVFEVVTPATIYEIWKYSLMMDLASSGNWNACDRFFPIGCVELLEHTPAGIYGFRKIGTFQVKSINLIF